MDSGMDQSFSLAVSICALAGVSALPFITQVYKMLKHVTSTESRVKEQLCCLKRACEEVKCLIDVDCPEIKNIKTAAESALQDVDSYLYSASCVNSTTCQLKPLQVLQYFKDEKVITKMAELAENLNGIRDNIKLVFDVKKMNEFQAAAQSWKDAHEVVRHNIENDAAYKWWHKMNWGNEVNLTTFIAAMKKQMWPQLWDPDMANYISVHFENPVNSCEYGIATSNLFDKSGACLTLADFLHKEWKGYENTPKLNNINQTSFEERKKKNMPSVNAGLLRGTEAVECIPSITIIIGNKHERIPDTTQGPKSQKNEHKWTAFVQVKETGCDWIESVKFFLPETFRDNSILIKGSPFEIKRIGWEECIIEGIISFHKSFHHDPIAFCHKISFSSQLEQYAVTLFEGDQS